MGLSIIGKSITKVDALEKATGKAIYLDDVVLPRTLVGKVLRSTVPHARLVNIDTSRAKALPGVKAVITGLDLPHGFHGPFIKDTPIFTKDKIRYIGEPIAAVAAVDEETANEALDLIDVMYEELPVVLDPIEAMSDDSPLVHDNVKAYGAGPWARRWGNVCSHTTFKMGDIERGFAESDYVFEDTFKTPEVNQVYLEPHGAVASFDASGKVTIWTTTQSIHRAQASVNETLGMPVSKIRVICTHVGGGFGGKVECITPPIATALAQKAGRPVKVAFTREEEFVGAKPRHPGIIRVKTGVKNDGTFVARQVRFIYDTGAYADDGPGVVSLASILARGPFKIPNVQIDGYCVHTNKTPAGAFRGFGNPQVTFAFESQMGIIAAKMGIDLLELHLKNAVENGDVNVAGQVMPSVGLKECLSKAAEAAGWGKPKSSPNRGMGISCMQHLSAVLSSAAAVRMNQDGSLTLIHSAADVGQGSDTLLAQIIAEEFGVSVDDINLVRPDTDGTPYNYATCASRTTFTMGNTVRLAALDAKKQLQDLAAEELEANPSDIVIADGSAFVSGSPERKRTFPQLAFTTHWKKHGPIIGTASYVVDGPPLKNSVVEGFIFGSGLSAWTFAAQVVEVEVDPETGQVSILNVASAHDVGRAINPINIVGQIEGGFAQGLGWALYEEVVRDKGKVVNPNLVDYRCPTAADVQKIISIIVEEPEPTGPYGAKGVGEPSLIATAPAIANAIYDAVGVRLKELPMTAEKVRKAIKEKRAE